MKQAIAAFLLCLSLVLGGVGEGRAHGGLGA